MLRRKSHPASESSSDVVCDVSEAKVDDASSDWVSDASDYKVSVADASGSEAVTEPSDSSSDSGTAKGAAVGDT